MAWNLAAPLADYSAAVDTVTYVPGTLLVTEPTLPSYDFASTYVRWTTRPPFGSNIPDIWTTPQFDGGDASIAQFVRSLGDPRFDSIIIDGIVITNDGQHALH
jgi:hypothetical protein